jgi:hypothetical protein
MIRKRSIVLATSVTLGVLAFAQPASAASPTFVDGWPSKWYPLVGDYDGDADTDARDFLIWQRNPS